MTTATQSPQAEVGLKERFFRYFQHEVTALQEQMERLGNTSLAGGERNDAIDHCLAGIERLSHEVKDASSYIPAYDQRTYGEAIKALSEKLQATRASFAPPKKFQFKTHRKNESAISLSDAAELAKQNKLRVPGYTSDHSSTVNSSFAPTPLEAISPTEEKTKAELMENVKESDTDPKGAVRKPSFSKEKSVSISNHINTHIILPTSASHATSSGTVSNLRKCVVDMSIPTQNGAPFAGLILKNIKDSLIVCGHVAGPAHITNVDTAVLVVSCRQFRMHNSKNIDVYLHCSSRPIIEDCEDIRFAPLPDGYETELLKNAPNQWDQVDDFKWLKAEPNPHWKVLPEAERVNDHVWKNIVPGGPSVSLVEILKAVTVLS